MKRVNAADAVAAAYRVVWLHQHPEWVAECGIDEQCQVRTMTPTAFKAHITWLVDTGIVSDEMGRQTIEAYREGLIADAE